MVVADESEAHLHHGEVNSSFPTDQSPENHHPHDTANHGDDGDHRGNNYAFPTLGRQSSIYSLTLDEFQHTLCESGKNFGSMNMDEFLSSIWTAEENQAHNPSQNHIPASTSNVNSSSDNPSLSVSAALSSGRCIAKQPSLQRQGSITLPPPLCRKTVDEVWSEIQRARQLEQQHQQMQPNSAAPESSSAQQHPQGTYGEMTLEDFLVKAGVVSEQCAPLNPPPQPPPPPPHHQHQYGLYPNTSNPHAGSTYSGRTLMGLAGGGVPPYVPMPSNGGAVGEPSGKGSNGYPAPPLTALCYGSRVGNGGAPAGGYGPGLALGSPVSPLSSDGLCGPSQVENSATPYGFDMGALHGRKRPIDGPVERVVERRQRRMIKNRESAARSRARKQVISCYICSFFVLFCRRICSFFKQVGVLGRVLSYIQRVFRMGKDNRCYDSGITSEFMNNFRQFGQIMFISSLLMLGCSQAYTVELEAKLNQLREENMQLKQALVINLQLPLSECMLVSCSN
ncbi:hypothetical protein Dimus_007007 [Dionaea muscipula]